MVHQARSSYEGMPLNPILQFGYLIVLVVLAVLVGYLSGGRLNGLLRLRLRWLMLLYLAVAVQIVEFYVPAVHDAALHGLGRLFTAVIFGLVIAWLLINFRSATRGPRVAYGLVAAGLALNGVCILVNGRMRFWLLAARAAGLPARLLNENSHVKNGVAGAHTKLVFLGDIVPAPGLAKIFSIGDLAIAAGIVVLVVTGMRLARSQSRQTRTRDAVNADR